MWQGCINRVEKGYFLATLYRDHQIIEGEFKKCWVPKKQRHNIHPGVIFDCKLSKKIKIKIRDKTCWKNFKI